MKTNTDNKKRKIKIAAVALAGVIASGAIWGGFGHGKKVEATETPVTESVMKQDLKKTVTVNGTIESTESATVTSILTDAKVLELNVKVGDRVKEGDVIAVLDSSDVDRALLLARENLELTVSKNSIELENARRNLDDVKTSDEVARERGADDEKTAEDDLDKAMSDRDKYQEKYIAAKDRQENIDVRVDLAKDEYEEAKKNVREKDREISKLQSNITSTEYSVSDRQEEYEEECKKHMNEDGTVNKNNAKVKEAKENLDDAKNDLKRLQAKLSTLQNEKAELDYKLDDIHNRYSELQTKQTEAKSKTAEAKTKWENSKEGTKTAKNNYKKSIESQEDSERSNKKAIAEGENSVKELELSAENSKIAAQQDVEKYEEQKKDAVVLAPGDGIVTSVSVKEGERYKGGEIVSIKNDTGYMVKLSVDQYDISDIEKGMKAIIHTDTTGDDDMDGKITFISPVPTQAAATADTATASATASSGEYPVEVTINNPSERLRFGMSAKVTLILDEVKDALTVSESAVQEDENGDTYVEVFNGMDEETNEIKTERIPVTYGLKTDYYVQIVGDGITEGMQVMVPEIESEEAEETTAE